MNEKINSNLLSFIVFSLPISLFFGDGISIIFSFSKTSTLLSLLISIPFIILYSLILLKVFDKGVIKRIKKYPKIISIPWIIIILITILILIIIIYYLTDYFIMNNYLTKTPSLLIEIILLLSLFYIIMNNYEVLLRVSFILIIISIILFITNLFGLIPYVKISNILPLYNYDIKGILFSSFIIFSLFTSPLFLITFINKNNIIDKSKFNKKFIIILLISLLGLFALLFIILSTLGIDLINIFEYPEYIVLKKIKISFIERVENIGFIIWSINSLIIASFGSLYIKNSIISIFKIKNNKIIFVISLILILLIYLVPKYIFKTSFMFSNFMYIVPIIFFIVFDLTIIILFMVDELSLNK